MTLLFNEEQLAEITNESKRKLMREMVSLLPAAELLESGLCDAGKNYIGWSLFHKIQYSAYNNHDNRKSEDSPKIGYFKYPERVASLAWKEIGSEEQDRWKTVADEIKNMPLLVGGCFLFSIIGDVLFLEKKVFLRGKDKKVFDWCSICLDKTQKKGAHWSKIHYPEHNGNENQRRLYDEYMKAVGR
jgi:hypothetical protein